MDNSTEPTQTPNSSNNTANTPGIPSPTPTPPVTPSTTPATGPVAGGPGVSSNKMLIKVVAIALVVVLVAGAGAWAFMGRGKKQDDTNTPKATAHIKVGLLLATSGGSSSMGYGALKGIQLAKKQLNADNFELVQADGKCDPDAAKEAMKYLVDQKVNVIIGENCSSASVAVLEQANQAHIPMVSPSASSPKLSIENDFFFRTVPSDIGQGTFLAQSMYNAGLRSVAVFYTNEPYGTAINDVFKQKFEALGGKVVAAVNGESSVIDLKTQADAIKAAKPDGVAVVTNSVVSSTAIMKLTRERGVAVPFYGGDNLYDNTIIANNGTIAEGLHVVSFPTGTKTFKQALVNEYHVTEQLYSAPEAYDAFKVIYLAAQKGAVTGDQFKTTIPTIKFADGASGPIEFDKYGEVPYATYKYDLLEVKDGSFQTVTQ
jgi:branched-chain amino acid transport system substrate-binding protein